MGISFDEAAKAQAALEDNLLKDPNVVSIGVVQEVSDTGEKTGNYVVQVGIVSSEVYQSALEKGAQTIPAEYVLPPEKGSTLGGEKHIRIQVVKEGQIQALRATSKDADFPSAIDQLPSSGPMQGSWKLRLRPSPCGHSIGHPATTAGTMGVLLRYTEGPDTKNAYVLSNNHVLAANNAGNIGDEITQPGPADSGRVGRDTLAYLHRWVPLDPQGPNYADVAVALVRGSNEWREFAASHISSIGYPQDIAKAAIGMTVEKTGRTTGHTHGEVVSINETIKVNYGPLGLLTFKGQIRTTPMSQAGDSGSSLMEKTSKSPIGLLFAGSPTASYFNHMDVAVRLLSQPHENKHPFNTTKFNSTYPFTIIRRNYCTSTTPLLPQDRESPVIPKKLHLQRNNSAFCSDRLQQHATQTLSRLTKPGTDKAVHVPEKPPVPTLTFKYQPKTNAALQVVESLRRIRLPRMIL